MPKRCAHLPPSDVLPPTSEGLPAAEHGEGLDVQELVEVPVVLLPLIQFGELGLLAVHETSDPAQAKGAVVHFIHLGMHDHSKDSGRSSTLWITNLTGTMSTRINRESQ